MSLLPPAQLQFKGVLDAMLGASILDVPQMGSQATMAVQDATSMRIGQFNKRVKEVITLYSPEEEHDH